MVHTRPSSPGLGVGAQRTSFPSFEGRAFLSG
jgi:hypothetical protein